MPELIAGILLVAGALYVVLKPVFRPQFGELAKRETGVVEDGEDPEDDLSPGAVALRALKEIEFDRATGKLSDADYDALKAEYTIAALAALRTEQGSREQGAGSRSRTEATAPGPLLPAPLCPTHGPRPEPDALFCSECGRRLTTAPGFCARCGTALERDARYCHSCGARVAA
jgi:double zinc ribbon protein